MRTLFIINHPYDGSFCNALLDAAVNGVTRSDGESDIIHLDKEGFNPVMSSNDLLAFRTARTDPARALSMLDKKVLDYKSRLEWAEHLVFIFPVWWMVMPSLTKGFIEKVIFPGVAYGYTQKGEMHSRLANLSRVTVITTMATPAEVYGTLMGDAVWRAIKNGTFAAIGVDNCHWMNFDRILDVSRDKRVEWLRDVEEYFAAL
ncbi:MAG: NAD(P)H-dependent oxidoreductase [Bacteroidaceae bacterium]|nr:NAD(P)H-dependent oxidoreductase [Bacteroidaceae bacterium]